MFEQNSQRWYPYMKKKDAQANDVAVKLKSKDHKCLMDWYTLDELSRKVVVSFETKYGSRSYTIFESHTDLYEHLVTRRDDLMRMHEIIITGNHQKPRFDIDISHDELIKSNLYTDTGNHLQNVKNAAEIVKDTLIDACIDVLARSKIYLDLTKNIIVCNSHGTNSKGLQKASYHIIIDGYMHSSEEEAEAFYNEVMKEINDKDIISFIDPQVYAKNQPFRLLWNHKLNDTRVKVLQEEFLYHGEIYRHIWPMTPRNEHHLNTMMLEASMISFVSGCIILPMYVLESKKVWNSNTEILDTARDKILGLLELCLKKKIDGKTGDTSSTVTHDELNYDRSIDSCSNNFDINSLFDINTINGGLITLTRKTSFLCPVCNVCHDGIHPYMFVAGTKLYFNCRRSKKHVGRNTNLYLGNLHQDDIKIVSNTSTDTNLSTEGLLGVECNPKTKLWMENKMNELNLSTEHIDRLTSMIPHSYSPPTPSYSTPPSYSPTPPYSTPSYSTPPYSTPPSPTPSYSTPPYSTPPSPTPSYSTPSYSTPSYSTPSIHNNITNGNLQYNFNTVSSSSYNVTGTISAEVPNELFCNPPESYGIDIKTIMYDMARTPMPKKGRNVKIDTSRIITDYKPSLWESGVPKKAKSFM